MTAATPSNTTGIIVTRGDVDLTVNMATWPRFADTIIYDNSQRPDKACFGRWCAAQEATTPFVFFQDDDVILPKPSIEAILAEWDEDDAMVCNMNPEWVEDEADPEFSYDDVGLVGAGSVLPRDVWEAAVIEYLSRWPEDRFFHEWADFVVGIGTYHRKVSYPYTPIDRAYRPGNLANTGGNRARRKAMMRRARRTVGGMGNSRGAYPIL